MKIYDTKKEAQEAAEAFHGQCSRNAWISSGANVVAVLCYGSDKTRDDNIIIAEFHYKPERVAPAENVMVVSGATGKVFYSRGYLNGAGYLCVSREPDQHGEKCEMNKWKVLPSAGQFAKAVELLEEWAAIAERHGLGCRDTIKLLDEIKAKEVD